MSATPEERIEALEDQITDLKLRLSHVETHLQYPDGPPSGGARLSGPGVGRVDVTESG